MKVVDNYLYHRAVPNLEGRILYPLNQLKNIYPNAYNEHVKKYIDREHLLETKIPILDCLWNDVLHLTAVSPIDLLNNLIKGGMKNKEIVWKKWFKIPISHLNSDKTIVCLYRRDVALVPDARDFYNFDSAKIEEYKKVPVETIEYYKDQFALGKRPLMFHLVPHILFKGTIDITDLEIVEI